MMTDLADWLLQQIADDEAAAWAAGPGEWRRDGINSVEDSDGRLVVYGDGPAPAGAEADHIARHDPARVLAECAAKRAIVKEFTSARDWAGHPDCPDESRDTYRRHAGSVLDVLRLLAQPYADCPGFDPAWKVET